MGRQTGGWALALGLALAACQPSGTGQASPDKGAQAGAGAVDMAEAQAAFDALVRDFGSGDTARVMAHYAPGARLFDAGHARPSADRNLQTQWTASFMTLKPADFTTEDLLLQPAGPNHFLASGISGFTANVGPGRTVLRVRFSQLFERQADGQWRIVHEHISGMPQEPAAPTPTP